MSGSMPTRRRTLAGALASVNFDHWSPPQLLVQAKNSMHFYDASTTWFLHRHSSFAKAAAYCQRRLWSQTQRSNADFPPRSAGFKGPHRIALRRNGIPVHNGLFAACRPGGTICNRTATRTPGTLHVCAGHTLQMASKLAYWLRPRYHTQLLMSHSHARKTAELASVH